MYVKQISHCIQGYHIYQEVRVATVREELTCEREPENYHNRNAVAVKISISHLPWKLPKLCSLFLRRSSATNWEGSRLVIIIVPCAPTRMAIETHAFLSEQCAFREACWAGHKASSKRRGLLFAVPMDPWIRWPSSYHLRMMQQQYNVM